MQKVANEMSNLGELKILLLYAYSMTEVSKTVPKLSLMLNRGHHMIRCTLSVAKRFQIPLGEGVEWQDGSTVVP